MHLPGAKVPRFGARALLVAMLLYGAGSLQAADITSGAPGSTVWVHGSFVNVRQAARNDAPVVEQWPTNTQVHLVARNGDWCEVEGPGPRRGFIACRLLGDKALTLADLAGLNPTDAARRAFWIVPSWGRLAAAGQALTDALLSAKQRETELQTNRPARWTVPEFEAAKARLRAGARLQAEQEVDPTIRPIPPATLSGVPAAALPPAVPSLWRKRTEFALIPSIDEAAALHGGTVRLLRILRGPEYHSNRNDDQWIDGTWDIGEAEVAIEPAAVAYKLAASGLLAANSIDSAVVSAGPAEGGCGSVDINSRYASWRPRLEAARPGYARIPREQELVGFFSAHSIRPDAVQVTTRDFRTSTLQADGQRVNGKLVVHAIDLNKDQAPDLVIIIGQVPGGISPFLMTKRIFVNIGGTWSLEFDMTEDDCT